MNAETILGGLVRVGTVTDVNADKYLARVKFQDTDMTSGWLAVLQHNNAMIQVKADGNHTHNISDTYTGGGNAGYSGEHEHKGSCLTYWLPKINDTVLVLYLPVFNADGFVLGGIA